INQAVSLLINQAVSLLILSIGISLISSYAITSVSPIKSVSTEILVRTNPTLLDVFIAIAAGAIAAIAIVEKKVSDSLAGVAIATSLMPPLCVSGIGLALSRYAIANGAFLLFCTNVVSIIFVSVLVFSFAGIRRESENGLRRTGIALISIVLIFTSIPLFILLKNYSFESQAYRVSQEILTSYLRSVSPEIYVENVSTSQVETEKVTVIRIEADVLIPEDVLIDYQQKTAIIQNLQSALGRDIELNLRVQKTISLVSQEDQHTSEVKKTLSDTFMNQIYQINSTMTLDSLNIFPKSSKDGWSVEAILRADPQNQLTENERGVLEKLLSDKIGEPVSLSIELISRVKLKSLPDIEQETIKTTIREYFGAISRDIDIAELTLSTEPLPGILKNVQSPIKPSILIT
ncbi:MAG: DUF389 domain-containing protein, partial [Bdellovibrionales bacterium]|nr:DUF389 domain-containing protein [Bdellovibrionales bacterium]